MENIRVHEKDNERHDKMEHVAVSVSDIDNVEQIHNMASVTNCVEEGNSKHVHGTDDVENVSVKNSLEQVHEVVEKDEKEKNQVAQDPDNLKKLDGAPNVKDFPTDNIRSACKTDKVEMIGKKTAKECAYDKNSMTNSHHEDFNFKQDIHEALHLESSSETVTTEKDKDKQKCFQYESVMDGISDLPQIDQKNNLMQNLRAKVSQRIQEKNGDSDKTINRFYRSSEEVLDTTCSGSVKLESAQGENLLPTTKSRSSLSGSNQMSQVPQGKDLKIILDHVVIASGEIVSEKHDNHADNKKIKGQRQAGQNQKRDADECIQNCLKNVHGKGIGASEYVKKSGGDQENGGQGDLKLKTSQEECRSGRKEAPVGKIVCDQSNIMCPDGGRPVLRNRLRQRINMKIVLDALSRVPPSEFFLPPEFTNNGFTPTPDLPLSSLPPAEPNRVRPARSCVMQMASLNCNVKRKVPWLKQESQSSKMSKEKLCTSFQAAMKRKSMKNEKSINFESKASVYHTRRTAATSSIVYHTRRTAATSSEPRNTRSTQAEASSSKSCTDSPNKARHDSDNGNKYKHLSPTQRAHLRKMWAIRKGYIKSEKHSDNGDKYKHLSPNQRAHLQNLWAMAKHRKRRKRRRTFQGLKKNQNENIQRSPNKKFTRNLNQGSKLRLVKNSTLKDVVSRIKQRQNLKRLRDLSDYSDTVGGSKRYKCEDLFTAQGAEFAAQNKFYEKISQGEENNLIVLEHSRKSRNHVTKSNSQQEVTYVQNCDSDGSDSASESSNNSRVGSPEIELDVDEYSDSIDFEHVYSPEPLESPEQHSSLSVNAQPHQTPSLNVQPHQTPSRNVQPHQTPSVNVQPHQTPSVNNQPRQTPSVNVQPHQTPSVNNQPRKLPIFQQKLPNPSPGPIAVLYYNPEAAMLHRCSEHHSCCQLNAANAAAEVIKVDSCTQWEDPLKLYREILAQNIQKSCSFKTSVIKYVTVSSESTNTSNAISQGDVASNLPSDTLHQKVGQTKLNTMTSVTMNSDHVTSTQTNSQGGLTTMRHDPASLSQGRPIVRPTNPHSSNSPNESTNSESCSATAQPDFSLSSNMTAVNTLRKAVASVSSGGHENANVKVQSFDYGPFSIPQSQLLSIKSGQYNQRLDNAHFLIKDGHLWSRPLNKTYWNKVDKDKYALVVQKTNGTKFLMLKVVKGDQTLANVVLELPVLTMSTR